MTEKSGTKVQLPINGMSCDSCAHHICGVLSEMPGVLKAEVSYRSNTAIIDFLPSIVNYDEIKRAIEEAGFGVESEEPFQAIQTKGC